MDSVYTSTHGSGALESLPIRVNLPFSQILSRFSTRPLYCFKVNLAEWRADLLVRYIDDLRAIMKTVKDAHQFVILAMVVLPEHLHAI